MSAAPIIQPDEDAQSFAQRYAEKALEQAQADAHAAINVVFGRMRDAVARPEKRASLEGVKP